MTICVTGAGGFIGSYVASRLSTDGLPVIGITNKAKKALLERQPSRVRWLRLDLATADRPLEGIEPVDCVIHLAGLAHRKKDPAGRNDVDAFMRQNFEASVRLAEDAVRLGVRRLIFVSSIAVYGGMLKKAGGSIDEEVIEAADDPYGSSKLAAERELHMLAARTGLELVILRPALVVGPGAPGNLYRLAKLIDRRAPIPVPLRDNKRSFVGLKNLYDLLSICINHPLAVNQVFVASDPEHPSTRAVVEWIAAGIEKGAVTVPLPAPAIRASLKLLGREDVFHKLYSDLVVTSGKAQSTLGWMPSTPLAESFKSFGRAFAKYGNA